MKTIALVSTHPCSGKTTIAVNLAAGMIIQGYKVVLLEMGDQDIVHEWLCTNQDIPENMTGCLSTDMGFDLVLVPDSNADELIDLQDLAYYDYAIIDSGNDIDDYMGILHGVNIIAACTDLRASEPNLLPLLDQNISAGSKNTKSIDLIIPTMINTSEWNSNTEILFQLMNYFGEDKIADMVPE